MSAYEENRAELEEKILGEAPRLEKTDRFKFACHPGVSCFGDCCGDVNILLTPRDVLRLKRRLGLDSSEFLARHTILPHEQGARLPAPLLKMQDNQKKSCPFLNDRGCSVYADRPWACRMYPLGFAAPLDRLSDGGRGNGEACVTHRTADGAGFWFLLEEGGCHGFAEEHRQTVEEWLNEQAVDDPDDVDALMREIAAGGHLERWRNDEPRRLQMLFMALYDLDTFRRFIFDSTFLARFDLDDKLVTRIRTDDEALLAFAMTWIGFSLLGRQTMTMGDDSQGRPEGKDAGLGRDVREGKR